VIIGTPTFRASLNFVWQTGLGRAEAVRRLNADAAAMHLEIRAQADHRPIYIAGVIGPSGDAYRPEESPPAKEAREYHGLQTGTLAQSGVDFLYAPTFSVVEKALGAAMGATGLPHVVSFVLERAGARRHAASRGHRAHRRRCFAGTAALLLDQLCSPLQRRHGSARRERILGSRRPSRELAQSEFLTSKP
jgi:S-methylmethionine-dependent homocysteine/selenocysteine methylase